MSDVVLTCNGCGLEIELGPTFAKDLSRALSIIGWARERHTGDPNRQLYCRRCTRGDQQ